MIETDEYIVGLLLHSNEIVLTRVTAPTIGDAYTWVSHEFEGRFKYAATVRYRDMRVYAHTERSYRARRHHMSGFFKWLFGHSEDREHSYNIGYERGSSYAEEQGKGLGEEEQVEIARAEYARLSQSLHLVVDSFYQGWYDGYSENQ